jgi:hypothetical protein
MNYIPQTQAFSLSAFGATLASVTVGLSSFKGIDGANLTMADFGSKGYAVIDPNNGASEEQISFTGITQNGDGSATLTGVYSVGFLTPYAETSGLAKDHAGGAKVVVSVSSAVLAQFLNKNNDETVSGVTTFVGRPKMASDSDSGNDADLATVGQLNRTALGTTLNTRTVTDGTAGETLVAGNLVYFKAADARWWKCDADTASTVESVLIGFAQGAGTAGNAVANGVLIAGKDSNQTGLTPGALYYASQTAGAITATPPTSPANAVAIGYAKSATEFIMDVGISTRLTEDEKAALAGTSGTPSANDDPRVLLAYGDGSDGDVTISVPTTISRVMNYNNLTISADLDLNGYIIRVKGTLTRTGTAKFISNGQAGGAGGNVSVSAVGGAAGAAGAAAGTGVFANLAGLVGAAGVTLAANPSLTSLVGNAGINGSDKTVSLVVGNSSVGGSSGGINGGSWGTIAGKSGGTTVASSNIDPLVPSKSVSSFLTILGSVYQQASQSTSGASGTVGQGSNYGSASAGGGGSGSNGGIIVVCAKIFVDSGSGILFQANGGIGGNGGTVSLSDLNAQQSGGAGGGAGGAGGAIVFVYSTTSATVTYEVNGGVGGSGKNGYGNYSTAGTNGATGRTGTYTAIVL